MTNRPFALRSYLTWSQSRRQPASRVPLPRSQRRTDAVLWVHAGDPETAEALHHLCDRLVQAVPDARVVLTGDDRAPHALPLPPETRGEASAFVAALAPRVGLWTGHRLAPAVLDAMHAAGTRLLGVGIADRPFTHSGPRWLPDPAPAILALFHGLYPASDAAARRLRRYGVPASRVRRAQPLLPAPQPLACPDADHEDLSGMLAARPVWLAAHVQGAEAGAVLRAQHRAVRLAHRLLLILVPADPASGTLAAEAAKASGLRLCRWDAGEVPDENTQVLLADDAAQLGLFYRVAPVTFLGGSLLAGHGGHDPLEAAVLGSAVLYGPHVGDHLASYTRLMDAGAARIVRDDDSLAAAVSALIGPDQAATMALAGWDVATAGAELTDAVLREMQALLEPDPQDSPA